MTSTKRGTKKQPTDAAEQDFEAFVRESLTRLCEGLEKIIQDISKRKAKVHLSEGALVKISIYEPQPKFQRTQRGTP